MTKKCWVAVDRNINNAPYSDCVWNDDCTYAERLIAQGKTKDDCKHWREKKEVESMKVEKYEEIKLLLTMPEARLIKICLDRCAEEQKYTEFGTDLKGLSDAMKALGVE